MMARWKIFSMGYTLTSCRSADKIEVIYCFAGSEVLLVTYGDLNA